jgi:hypothetical protein
MTTAKEYKKIKNNPEKHSAEKERVNALNKSKYANDPEFRAKVISYQRKRYEALKALKDEAFRQEHLKQREQQLEAV